MTKDNKRQHQNADNVQRADVKLRLPVRMLNQIQSIANDCGVPCKTLIKVWVAEKVLSRRATSPRSGANGR
jgi:hypothetical protein